MPPRSRTGCLTCRSRKLKCSEDKPVCSQCVKANRECIPASGITFRHQQNPSLNAAEASKDSLKNFYGYKETFGEGTVWVDVPQQLDWVHTNNPYLDDEDGPGGGYGQGDAGYMNHSSARYTGRAGDVEYRLAQSAYPAYATQGLEALSAVASQDQYSYAPPPAPMSQHESAPEQQSTVSEQQGQTTSSASNIDPRLHAELVTSQAEASDNTEAQQEGSKQERSLERIAQDLISQS